MSNLLCIEGVVLQMYIEKDVVSVYSEIPATIFDHQVRKKNHVCSPCPVLLNFLSSFIFEVLVTWLLV